MEGVGRYLELMDLVQMVFQYPLIFQEYIYGLSHDHGLKGLALLEKH